MTSEERLNLQLDGIIDVLGCYLLPLGTKPEPGAGHPLAEWVLHEVKAARWAEADEWGLNFKRTALRAFEETPYAGNPLG